MQFKLSKFVLSLMAILCLSVPVSAYEDNFTIFDCVMCVRDSGFPVANVNSIRDFFIFSEDELDSGAYTGFVNLVNDVRSRYISPLADTLYGKYAADLTEDEKREIWCGDAGLSSAERSAIFAAFVSFFDAYGVTVVAGEDDFGCPVYYYTLGDITTVPPDFGPPPGVSDVVTADVAAGALSGVVSVLPTVLLAVVGFIGIRKGLGFLLGRIRSV